MHARSFSCVRHVPCTCVQVRARYLDASWRWMLALTAIAANVIDMPFTFLTIFNVVRNQYFLLDDGFEASLAFSHPPLAFSRLLGTSFSTTG